MTVRKRRWKDAAGVQHEAWSVDVRVVGKDGKQRRIQRTSPIQSRRAAERLEHAIREELLNMDEGSGAAATIAAPQFSAFADKFMITYAATNNKPSECSAKESILRVHLLPEFGNRRLDQIGAAEIEEYKSKKAAGKLSRKSINNHLTGADPVSRTLDGASKLLESGTWQSSERNTPRSSSETRCA